jgi:hypothetical protein
MDAAIAERNVGQKYKKHETSCKALIAVGTRPESCKEDGKTPDSYADDPKDRKYLIGNI